MKILSISHTPTNMGIGEFDYIIWCECQTLDRRPRNIPNAIITFIEWPKHSMVAQQDSPIALIANDALHKTSFAL